MTTDTTHGASLPYLKPTARVQPMEKSSKLSARLARNRTTARLRRERKKAEAVTLTRTVAGLTYQMELYSILRENLSVEDQASVDAHIKQRGPPPQACEYCEFVFVSQVARDHHVLTEHVNELKTRQTMRVQENALREELSSYLREPGTGMSNQSESGMIDGNALQELSPEARRKRRLQRNAASARLCRQRKKLYVENLRLQLPVLKHKVEVLGQGLSKVGVPVNSWPIDVECLELLETSLKNSVKSIAESSSMTSSSSSSGDEASPSSTLGMLATFSLVQQGVKSVNGLSPLYPVAKQARHIAQLKLSRKGQAPPKSQLSQQQPPAMGTGVPVVGADLPVVAAAQVQAQAQAQVQAQAQTEVQAQTQAQLFASITAPPSTTSSLNQRMALTSLNTPHFAPPSMTTEQGATFGRSERAKSAFLEQSTPMFPSTSGGQQAMGMGVKQEVVTRKRRSESEPQMAAYYERPVNALEASSLVFPAPAFVAAPVQPVYLSNNVLGHNASPVEQLLSLQNQRILGTESLKKARCADPDVVTAAMALFECAHVVSPSN